MINLLNVNFNLYNPVRLENLTHSENLQTEPPQALLETKWLSPTQRFMNNHSLFLINRALQKFRATEKDIKLFKYMISQETQGFLGYQAGSSTVRIFQDILFTIVREILQIPIPDDFVFLRVPGDPIFCYESSSTFLQKYGSNIPRLNWDTQPGISQHLLSLNMNLYQSYDADWDLTPRYYLENTTWTHVNVRDLLKPFFLSLGIDREAVDLIWRQALGLLSHKHGYIIQFFDESKNFEYAREHSYIAYSGGKPHPSYMNHEIFDTCASDFPQIRLVLGNESILNPFSSIRMKRYDDMSTSLRMRYESKLSALIEKLAFDPKKVAAVRENLLKLWNVEDSYG